MSDAAATELMTELAYIVREDWAQRETTVEPQSAVIRDWIGGAPYLFAVTDLKKFNGDDRGADVETAQFIAPDAAMRKVLNISELAGLTRGGKALDHAVVILHPYGERDLNDQIKHGSLKKVFIMIWSARDEVRNWLDGCGALNLHTGEALPAQNPVMIEAAKLILSEEYNGLSSGHGKDVVVQLVRAFTMAGYPLGVDAWLRAYFAAGGTFRHGESVAQLINEMRKAPSTAWRPATATTSSQSFTTV